MRKILCLILLGAFPLPIIPGRTLTPAWAQAQSVASVAPARTPAELRREAFDIVWTTVKEKHFDPTFGGVDWDQVRQKYRPRLDAITTDQEFYDLLQQMLGELRQSHFNIYPPGTFIEEESSEHAGAGVGLDLRILDGQAVITRVEPDSAAARAGLRPGFILLQIEDTPVERIKERFASSREPDARRTLRLVRALRDRLLGRAGTSVRLVYLDEQDRQREVVLVRQPLKGEMSPPLGNFPSQYTEFEARRLAGGIGYIRFNVFVVPLMEKIRAAIRAMSDAPGLIFDLRGNPGGIGGMAPGIAGLLETRQLSLGRMNMRTGYQNFVVFPQPNPYTGPVVILIDGGSGSTTEIFAAGLQEIGRAIVIGERSLGAALPSIFHRLPTGALFQYAIADFITPRGTMLEGRGVVPDIEIRLTRRALLDGGDPALEAAIEYLQKHRKSSRRMNTDRLTRSVSHKSVSIRGHLW
ncbi:MAG TPA: S41 family peptidase [Blastocatellia bacterium]|nr:S41 family peptidase [Blastocatellia bacterium]